MRMRYRVSGHQRTDATAIQKANLSWERFIRNVDHFFPPIKGLHLPCHRFDVHRPFK
jgi:hypothetical protein